MHERAAELDPAVANKQVGGASDSQHLYAHSGLVRHVDARQVGPNTTGGTVAEPTVFAE